MNFIDIADAVFMTIATPTLWLAGLLPGEDPALSMISSSVISLIVIGMVVTLTYNLLRDLAIEINIRATGLTCALDPQSLSALQRWPFRAYCRLEAARWHVRSIGRWTGGALIIAVAWAGLDARTFLHRQMDSLPFSPPSIADTGSFVAIAVVVAALVANSSLRARASLRSQRHQEAIRARAATSRTADQIGYGIRKCLESLRHGVPEVFDQALRQAGHPEYRATLNSSGVSLSSERYFWPDARREDERWQLLYAETRSLVFAFAQRLDDAVEADAFSLMFRSAPSATAGMLLELRPTPRIVTISTRTRSVLSSSAMDPQQDDRDRLPSQLGVVNPHTLEQLLDDRRNSLIHDLRAASEVDGLRQRLQQSFDWIARLAAEANWYALTMDYYARTAHRVTEGSGWAKASERLIASR